MNALNFSGFVSLLILLCPAWALPSPSPGPPYFDAATRTAGLPALVETRQHDSLGRLVRIGTASGHHHYTHDRDHQRTRVDLADGSHWEYEYDAKGQLVGGTKFDPAGNEVPSQSCSYTYDDIGNRTEATEGLSEPALHSPNALNQYSQRAVPSTVGVLGRADPAAAVAVNGVLAARSGVHFSRPLGVDNTSNAVWQTVDTIATKPAGAGQPHDLFAAETGTLFVARNPETFHHDADGNLLQDGRWDYSWNSDNRLVRMETRPDLPAEVPRLLLEFAYDHLGRRFCKEVTRPASGATETTLYHYDGWNLVHEEVEGAPARSYVWGLDLSGSLQGAGGVVGLQWAVNHQTGETHAPEYDGNGNIVRWTALAGGAESFAELGYAPFGGELVSFQNRPDIPFGFSTKYRDAETGLLYYGYRYYNPQTGRWLNRDPIGELGGVNLYVYSRNSPIDTIDLLGLEPLTDEIMGEILEDIDKITAEVDALNLDGNGKHAEFQRRLARSRHRAFLLTEQSIDKLGNAVDRCKGFFHKEKNMFIRPWPAGSKRPDLLILLNSDKRQLIHGQTLVGKVAAVVDLQTGGATLARARAWVEEVSKRLRIPHEMILETKAGTRPLAKKWDMARRAIMAKASKLKKFKPPKNAKKMPVLKLAQKRRQETEPVSKLCSSAESHGNHEPKGHENPMKRTRRNHSPAFKARVAKEALKGVKTIREIADENQLHPVQVSSWKKQLEENMELLFERKNARDEAAADLERRAERAERKLGQILVEKEFLEKKCSELGIEA